MKTSTLVLGAALLDFAFAIHLIERRDGPARVLHLDTHRKQAQYPPHVRDRLRKRDSTLQVDLTNEQTLYFVNISLGTPAQDLRLDIDTGSSDLWANAASSELCQDQRNLCGQSGTYDANSSSTYSYVNSDFYIKYADGTYAIGDYVTDTLSIGGSSIDGMQFGIGYNSTSQNGILGVGYETNEVQISYTGNTYPNLPALLAEKNVIQSSAYSLWLNDLDANTGSILFGGVDTDKYHGSLSTLPIIKEQGEYREFIIALTALSADNQSVFSNQAIPVLLDSGSSLSYLPDDYVNSIYSIFNANYDEAEGAAIVDCSLADQDATVDFTFSSPVISVSLSELVIVAGYRGNTPICILGISPAGDSTSVLGDTFLRSAYVVYDLANNQISVASTNFNATSSSVKEIGSGASSVPDATVVQNAVSSAAVASGGARNGGLATDVTSAAGNGQSKMLQDATSIMSCVILTLMGMTVGVGLVTW